MSGKIGAGLALIVTLAILAGQLRDGLQRLEASRLLRRAESVSLGVIAVRQVPRKVLQDNIQRLRQAGRLDPLEVGVPLALGSQYLLLSRPQAAADAYRRALAVEPRPEVHLNLGKALYLAGQKEEARRHFEQAVILDWHMEAQVPAE